MVSKLVYKKANAGKCPHCDGIVLSLHIHDFNVCGCGKTFTDGGFDYQRCTADIKPLDLYVRVPHEVNK